MPLISHAKALLLIVPATLALAFLGVRSRQLMESSEGRVACVAQAMLESGDWIVPHLNGEIRKEKPAFSSWCVAAVARLSGSARVEAPHVFIPPGLAALALILLAYGWGAQASSARGDAPPALLGMLAAVILAGTPGLLLQARSGELDMLLALFVALAYWGFYTHRVHGCRWALLAGYFALALGIHTKAHVALLMALPPLLIWHWLEAGRMALPKSKPGAWRWHLLGIALLLLLVVPYAVAFIRQSGITWADFNKEGGTARFDSGKTGHDEAWYWYFLQIPGWFLPWFLLLPVALAATWRNPPDERSPLRRLCWLWFGVNLILFSLPSAKQRHYAVPFFFPLGLLIADGTERLLLEARHHKLAERTLAGILLLLGAGLPIVGFFAAKNLAQSGSELRITYCSAGLAGLLFIAAGVCWLRSRRVFLAWWLGLVGVVALRMLTIESAEARTAGPQRFCESVRRALPPKAELYDYNVAFANHVYRAQVLFYLQRRIIRADMPLNSLVERARTDTYALASEKILATLRPGSYEVLAGEAAFLGHKNDVALIHFPVMKEK